MELEELAQLVASQDDSALWQLDEAWRTAQELRSTDPRSGAERLAQLAPLWARMYATSRSMQWYPDQLSVVDAAVADLEHPGEALTELQAAAHLAAVEWVTWTDGLSAVTLVDALRAADDFDQRFGGADQPLRIRWMWAQSRYVRALVLGVVENPRSKIVALDTLAAQLATETDEELRDSAQNALVMACSEMLDVDPVEATQRLQGFINADPHLAVDETVWAYRVLLGRRWSELTPPDQAGRAAVLSQVQAVIAQAVGGQRTPMRVAQLGGLWSIPMEDAIRRVDYTQIHALTQPFLSLADGAEPAVREEVLATAIMWARGIDRSEQGQESEHSLAAWAELGRRFGNDTGDDIAHLVATVWIEWASHETSFDRAHALSLYHEAVTRFGDLTHPEVREPMVWTRLNYADYLRRLNRPQEAIPVAEALAAEISADNPAPERRAAVIALRMLGTRIFETGTETSLKYLRQMLDTFGADPDPDVRAAIADGICRLWTEPRDAASAAWGCEQFRLRFDADTDSRVVLRNNSRIDYEATVLLESGLEDQAVALLGSLVDRWRESPDPAIVEDVRNAQYRINKITTSSQDPLYQQLAAEFDSAAGYSSPLMRGRVWKKVIKKARNSPDGKTALLAMRAHVGIVRGDVDDELWTFADRSSRAGLKDWELLRERIEPVAADELAQIHLDLLWFAAKAQDKLNELDKAYALYTEIEKVAGQTHSLTSDAAQTALNCQLYRARLLVRMGNIPGALSTYSHLIATEQHNQTNWGMHRMALAASERADVMAQTGDWRSAAQGYRDAFHAALEVVADQPALVARIGVLAAVAWAHAGDAATAASMADQLRATGIPLDHEQHQQVAGVLAWARPQ